MVFPRPLLERDLLVWVSGLCDKYPEKPILNKILLAGVVYQSLAKIF